MDVSGMTKTQLVSLILGDRLPSATAHRIAEMLTTDEGIDHDILALEPGVGPMTIARIEAAQELGKRIMISKAARKYTDINSPDEVDALMRPVYTDEDREVFHVLMLNTKNRLIRMRQISVGTLNASIVHPRELFKEAVKISAASVVMTHNHPSGDPTPSDADIRLTHRLIKAGELIGIELIDHVIIGDTYVSMREEGMI